VTGKEGLKGVDEDGAAGRVPSLSSVHHFRRRQHGATLKWGKHGTTLVLGWEGRQKRTSEWRLWKRCRGRFADTLGD
jgi:hypothetical protein